MSAWLELHTVLSLRLDATEAYRLMHNYRDEEIAKRDAMTVTWLIKKARELRAEGGKQHAAQADAVAAMASKIARGAVRSEAAGQPPVPQHYDKVPDPADGCHWCACGNRWPCKDAPVPDFFQPGHTYTEPDGRTDWKFRCDAITTHPETGERIALGWRHFRGEWSEYAYGEDDWEIHQIADHIDATEAGEGR